MSMDSYHVFEVIDYKDIYYPEHVLTNSANHPTYWLAPEGVVDVGFTIDRGCMKPFDLIVLRNTYEVTGSLRYVTCTVLCNKTYLLITVDTK